MTPKEALAVLVAAFRLETIEEPTIRLYERKLRDIPRPLLAQAVDRIVETARRFPTIAEIRDMAFCLAGVLPPSADEALAIVRKADLEVPVCRRDGTYAYTERYWEWPEDMAEEMLALVRNAVATVADPVARDGKRKFGWEQAFKAAYTRIADEARPRLIQNLSPKRLGASGEGPRLSLEAAPVETGQVGTPLEPRRDPTGVEPAMGPRVGEEP